MSGNKKKIKIVTALSQNTQLLLGLKKLIPNGGK